MTSATARPAPAQAELPLVEREPVGGGLVRLAFDAAPLAHAYGYAGQYVRVALDGDSSYFALASAPGDGVWELVVRDTGGVTSRLLAMPLGARVAFEGALGSGFAEAVVTSPTLLVAAVGSGVAVARAVLAARRQAALGAGARAALYLGVRDADDVPFAAELAALADESVGVVLCASRRSEGPAGLVVRTGWVQAVLATELEAGRLALGCEVVAVGPDALVADLRALEAQGRLGTVHVNF